MGDSFKTVFAVFVGFILISLLFYGHVLYNLFWNAEKATINLSNCNSNCEIHGTLRMKPVTGELFLEAEDGRQIFIKESSYHLIEYQGK